MDMPPWFATKHVECCYRQHNVLHGSSRPFDIFHMCSFTIAKTGEKKKNSQKSISHVTDLQVLQLHKYKFVCVRIKIQCTENITHAFNMGL